MFKFLKKKQPEPSSKKKETLPKKGDLISLIRSDAKYFIEIETNLIHKPSSDIESEIELGLNIYNLELKLTDSKKTIVIIPPKYEFWSYFLLAVKLNEIGYRVVFVYHKWAKELVEKMKPNLTYLRYQNLILADIDEFNSSKYPEALVVNLSDSYKGIQNNIPAFSTAVVSDTADLDYVMAYILQNTFAFAGLKKSNLKRIIIDETRKKEFQEKIHIRLKSVDPINPAKIKSRNLKDEIHKLVSESIAEGANLIVGGEDFESDYYKNIVLDEVPKEARSFQKNFYGPVLLLTYSDFGPQNLKDVIKQQPSNGIVVFTNDLKFIDMHSIAFSTSQYVLRPYDDMKYSIIFENNPSLEKVFKFLGII